MKRWRAGFAIVLLATIFVFFSRSTSTQLLQDSDTKVMLQRIEARAQPLSWFAGDWPLQNHFYRPVVAETFEIDHALYGWQSQGYGRTNAILCCLCILALFWMAREVTSHVLLSTGSACLFAYWHLVSGPLAWLDYALYALIGISLLAAVAALISKESAKLPGWLAAAGGAVLLRELSGLEAFRGGMIDWVPGRTASTMALFCLIAMAAYARYERTSAPRNEPDPGPLDPPATRGTEVAREPKLPAIWIGIAGLATFLALASYEQAVMLPAILIGIAVAFRMQHYRPRWAWHAMFWAILIGYFVLRAQVIPAGTSSYQAQQFRSGPATYITLADYVFPAVRNGFNIYSGSMGFVNALISQNIDIFLLLANAAFVAGIGFWSKLKLRRRDRSLVTGLLFGLAASFVAFLPMAWLKPFTYNHYHYWPLALRSVFVMAVILVVAEWLTSALSRRAIQAPRRLSPAPGSLPHP